MPDDHHRPIRRQPAQLAGKPPALPGRHGEPVRAGQWQPPVKRPPLTCANDPRQLPFEFLRDAAEAER
jgi:hypothetical protein